MHKSFNVRWGWLKFMYIYTIVIAGGFGLGVLFIPDTLRAIFGFPGSDQITAMGIVGSENVAFALLSILGLLAPLKYVPVLLLQMTYKTIWLAGVILPALLIGKFPGYAIPITVLFLTFIIGDLIAIPFSYLFARKLSVEVQMR